MSFLLGRLICGTRQEPDKGERTGAVHGEALGPARCGIEQQPNGLRGALAALQALRGFLHGLSLCPQFLLGLGGEMQIRKAGNRLLEGELNKVWYCPEGMGEIAGKLYTIDAQR